MSNICMRIYNMGQNLRDECGKVVRTFLINTILDTREMASYILFTVLVVLAELL